MKVLYITVSMPYGPHEPFFIPEVQEMLRQGCDMLIVQRSPLGEFAGGDTVGLDKRSLPRPLFNLEILATAVGVAICRPLRTLRALGWMFRSRNLSMLLKNLSVFPKALWIARVARQWGAAHIHAQWALTTCTMGMVAGEIAGIPWSCTAHRGDIVENNLLASKIRRASFMRFIARDGIAAAESICGRPLPGNVILLHSCVDMPAEMAFSNAISDPPRLLCPGYLYERKGQKYLIDAVRLLREWGVCVNLQFAGGGPMQPALESLVAEYGMQSQVSLLGQVEHTALLDMFRNKQVDAVVLPTLHEGIPAALIEPMAYGVPVIATNVGGIPELLEGGAGIMVPPKDPTALAEAIRRLIGDAALRARLVKVGRERVETGWAVRPVVAELLQHIGAFTQAANETRLVGIATKEYA